MIEHAFEVFGKNSFQNAIFYSNEKCLKFKLSVGDEEESYVKMFTSALNRSTQIIESVFEESEEVSICLTFYGDSFLSNLKVFKELKKLQILIPKENLKLRERLDEECNKNYLFFNINKSELHKFLFGKIGAELGIKPSFWFGLYIYDINLGILVHPYDDRGMDVVGPNKMKLKKLYIQHHSYLLNYDINVMKDWFDSL